MNKQEKQKQSISKQETDIGQIKLQCFIFYNPDNAFVFLVPYIILRANILFYFLKIKTCQLKLIIT